MVHVAPEPSLVDVLIVGAGPAGLMAANALVKTGVSVRIIDKRDAKLDVGQADGIQPRTIEVFQSYGLASRLIKEGNQLYTSAFYDPAPDGGISRSSRAARKMKGQAFDISAPRYTYSITLHQGDIETIFVDSLREQGADVERARQPSALTLDEDEEAIEGADSYPCKAVVHALDAPEGEEATETIYAKYVIGCDGAHSWVRKQLGFTMDGEQSNYVWGVVDCEPVTNFPDIRNRCLIHSHAGSMMVIPRERDIVRLYTQLSEGDAQEVLNVAGRVDRTKWTAGKLLEICKRQLRPYDIEIPEENISWWTLYIIGQRVASKYSKRSRIFIAGDACHTHSPKAGQGMNASMNDTHNLAWKLAYVLRGWGDRSLLETYEFERRKYAQDLIEFDRKWSTLFSGKPRTADNEGGVSHDDMLQAYKTFSGFASGNGILYAPSPITQPAFQHLAPQMRVGMRMPPLVIVRAADARPFDFQELIVSDGRFKVFVFAGDVSSSSSAEGGAQRLRLETFVREATARDGFLVKYGRRRAAGGKSEAGEKGKGQERGMPWDATFETFTVLKDAKEEVEYTVVPAPLRPHWTSVFVDDTTVGGRDGGDVYELFGIGPKGVVAVVRPDGYVGMLAPLDCARELAEYFGAFMTPSADDAVVGVESGESSD